MCEQCADAAKRLYPELDAKGRGSLLWNTTCFPFGSTEQVVEQIESNRAQFGEDLDALYQWVDDEMGLGMRDIHEQDAARGD